MAYRLGDYVVYGEFFNTKNYVTFGHVVMRGETPDDNLPILVHLTGNCGPDLQGKHFRFYLEDENAPGKVFLREEHRGLRDQQIGPTGTMTAEGWVRTFDCSIEEFLRRSKLGEPPPTKWKRHLYLEWFSQNGRVVIELGGAVVEECVREPRKGDETDEGEWKLIPNLAIPPELDTSPKPAGPSFTVVRMEDDDTAHVETWTPPVKEDASEDGDSFQRQLDRDAAAVDRAVRGEDDADVEMAETELMDYCIDHSEEKPLSAFIGNTGDLPAPEDLDDEQVESRLGGLLAQMAMLGVALDVCEHFTPRDCYRLLRDRVLHDGAVFEELIGTGWVTHIPTSEYCEACDKKFDEECDHDLRN
ncbi:MAG: hypothetical protein FJY92_00435 [Candidatus Hydrogenedentes bacterium]|nr:hypothetical protein [Candidatus Hydrogenedentota bacterium]